eukprot:508758_1
MSYIASICIQSLSLYAKTYTAAVIRASCDDPMQLIQGRINSCVSFAVMFGGVPRSHLCLFPQIYAGNPWSISFGLHTRLVPYLWCMRHITRASYAHCSLHRGHHLSVHCISNNSSELVIHLLISLPIMHHSTSPLIGPCHCTDICRSY